MAVIVAKQTRGPGTVRSAWRDIRGIAQPDTAYVMTPLLDQADIDDPTIELTLTIEVSDDGVGARDYVLYSNTFQLGRVNRHTGQAIHTAPSFQYTTSSDPPNFIRAMTVLPRSMSVGLDISLS